MRISDWSSDVCSSDLRSKAEHYRREPMAKAWALASRPQGMPAEANFELIDLPQRALADGEVRIANRWLSVDPYMRGRMNDVKSYVPPYALGEPMPGGAVGEVIESRADGIVAGDRVLRT